MVFGFTSSIPPGGSKDSIPVTPILTWDHNFFMEPGDTLWIGCPGPIIGVPDVSICFSPLPVNVN